MHKYFLFNLKKNTGNFGFFRFGSGLIIQVFKFFGFEFGFGFPNPNPMIMLQPNFTKFYALVSQFPT